MNNLFTDNVLLIHPPWERRRGNIWKYVAGSIPPLGIAYIASFLERHGIKVNIIDCQVEGNFYKKIQDYIIEKKPQYVGITATTPIFYNSLKIASMVKGLCKETKIVLGGPHPSALPFETISEDNIDFVVIGEGEKTFKELVIGIEPQKILGLYYKDGENKILNYPRSLIPDLDSLPYPAYHLLPIKCYKPALANYKRLPSLGITTTRGCYGKCIFCYREIFGNNVRAKSVENLIKEIEYLKNKYRIRDISFYDDIFLGSKEKVEMFCKLFLKKKLAVIWGCNLRPELTDKDLLLLMKKAGCYIVDFGVETGNEDILNNIQKGTTLSEIKRCVRLAKNAGFIIKCGFMIGHPEETKNSMLQTLNLAIELEPDTAMFNITTPFPGTELFKWAKENNLLQTKDWSKYDYSHVILNLQTVKPEETEKFYKTAYRKFYIRIKYLIKRFLSFRNFEDIKMGIKALLGIVSLIYSKTEKIGRYNDCSLKVDSCKLL